MKNHLVQPHHGEVQYGRMIGRSTSIALRALAEAVGNPGKKVTFHDHMNVGAANQHLLHMVRGMVKALELCHITSGLTKEGQVWLKSDHLTF